jgi:hypothetical protein
MVIDLLKMNPVFASWVICSYASLEWGSGVLAYLVIGCLYYVCLFLCLVKGNAFVLSQQVIYHLCVFQEKAMIAVLVFVWQLLHQLKMNDLLLSLATCFFVVSLVRVKMNCPLAF